MLDLLGPSGKKTFHVVLAIDEMGIIRRQSISKAPIQPEDSVCRERIIVEVLSDDGARFLDCHDVFSAEGKG